MGLRFIVFSLKGTQSSCLEKCKRTGKHIQYLIFVLNLNPTWICDSCKLTVWQQQLTPYAIFPYFHLGQNFISFPVCQKGTGKKSHWTDCEPVSVWSFSIFGSFAGYSPQQKLPEPQMWQYQMVNQFAVFFVTLLISRTPQKLFSLWQGCLILLVDIETERKPGKYCR